MILVGECCKSASFRLRHRGSRRVLKVADDIGEQGFVLLDESGAGIQVHSVSLQRDPDDGCAGAPQHLDDAVIRWLFDQDGCPRRDQRTGNEVDDLKCPLAQQDLVGLKTVSCGDELPKGPEPPK